MSEKQLERIFSKRYEALINAEKALSELDDFCKNKWGFTFHDCNLIESGDRLVDQIDYATSFPDVKNFIKFMNKQKTITQESQP